MSIEKFDDDTLMPFGKEHYGKRLEEVPAKYLLWMYEQPWFKAVRYIPLRDYIIENMDVLEKEILENR